jgi:predicted RNA-binding protein
MCQMSAVVERDGKVELLKENIIRLDMLTTGVRVSTLFEGSTELVGMTIHHIDFLTGKVFLHKQL